MSDHAVARMTTTPMLLNRFRATAGSLLLAIATTTHAATYPADPALGAGLLCVSDGGVVCLDAKDLSVRWRALGDAHTLEPVIAGGLVLVGGGAGLHALEADTGERRWHWAGEGLVFAPTIGADTAYAADRAGHVVALELEHGSVRWQRDLGGWSYPPAVVGGRLVSGGREGVVRALAPGDGATLWRHELGQELVYRPVPAAGLAVVTTFGGRIVAYAPDGRIAWQARDAVPSFSPAVAGPLLLFGGMDGRLRARVAATGAKAWDFQASGQLARPARHHAASDEVALVDADGHAFVLDGATGRLLLRVRIPGPPTGGPVHRPGAGWIVPYRDRGTMRYLPLSQTSADD